MIWSMGHLFFQYFIPILSVVAIDVSLAVDNAIVLGVVVAGLPVNKRKKALALGVGGAALIRIIFAVFAVQLLSVFGVTLAGGLLLLWVSWKLWREMRQASATAKTKSPDPVGYKESDSSRLIVRRAVWQILLADFSMSLDNTLAVAGAARKHFWVMVFGLAFSVFIMGVAAQVISGGGSGPLFNSVSISQCFIV